MKEFNRVEYKTQAKVVLKNDYWKAFLVCLIASFLGAFGNGGGSIGGSAGSSNIGGFSGNSNVRGLDNLVNFSSQEDTAAFGTTLIMVLILVAAVLIVALMIYIIMFGITCFLTNPIVVGMNQFFLKHRNMDGTSTVGDLFGVFRKETYISAVKTMFKYSLHIFLWSLLFVIPGIIKSYEYFFVPFIVAENPNIDTKYALELSKNMTYGHKMDIFVTNLSFMGWYILGGLCCGVGTLFVHPYVRATYTEMYKALSAGMDSGMNKMNF